MYQTWAYLGTDTNVYGPESWRYPDPVAMQADLTANYAAAVSEINSLAGSAVASVAPVGQNWEKLAFAADLYGGYDTKHPGPRGSLISGGSDSRRQAWYRTKAAIPRRRNAFVTAARISRRR